MKNSNLRFEEILITPSLAKEILESNICNRRVSKVKLELYANEMATGNWKSGTGETIKISKNKVLIDGQHRLLAIIKSNTSSYFYISFNHDDDIFQYIDTGKMRNSKDVFTIAGVKNSTNVPTIISKYNHFKKGKMAVGQIDKKATNAMLLDQYNEDAQFWNSVHTKSINWYNSFARVLPPSLIGGFYSYTKKHSFFNAEDFMDQLCTGMNISNNVIYLLRNKLIEDKVSPKKMLDTIKNALIIKAWNVFVKDEKIKMLKYDSERETYPIIILK